MTDKCKGVRNRHFMKKRFTALLGAQISRPEISIHITFDESEGSASVYVAPVPALKVTQRYTISLQNADVAVILTVSLTENEAPTNQEVHSASETDKIIFFARVCTYHALYTTSL